MLTTKGFFAKPAISLLISIGLAMINFHPILTPVLTRNASIKAHGLKEFVTCVGW